MANAKTTAVRGRWVLGIEDGKPTLLPNRYVLVEGNTIAAIVADKPRADRIVEAPNALVMPGFINLHNHVVTELLVRGMTEDRNAAAWASELIYGLLMPMGDLAVRTLTPEEFKAAVRLSLLQIVKGGTATLLDIFRLPAAEIVFDTAIEMGLRFYGAPYLFSTEELGMGKDGKPSYAARQNNTPQIERCKTLHGTYNGAAGDRIRVALGPHGADTCSPDLLREIRVASKELGCLVTIHLAQSEAEIEVLGERYGRLPADHLAHVGLLGPDVLAAHCVYASDGDLGTLARSNTTIVSCPRTFARGGVPASFHRFTSHGVRTAIGTDGYSNDFIGEMRAAALISKLVSGESDAASSRALVDAATIGGAAALGRDDLGRIAPGARADLTIVSLNGAHLQPVSDPLRTMLWNASCADVAGVMVDGEMLVDGGRFVRGDEARIVRDGNAAIERVWREAALAGLIGQERLTA
jgi:cytosine/adenosine deaminase-related metal-dependent hydrolase